MFCLYCISTVNSLLNHSKAHRWAPTSELYPNFCPILPLRQEHVSRRKSQSQELQQAAPALGRGRDANKSRSKTAISGTPDCPPTCLMLRTSWCERSESRVRLLCNPFRNLDRGSSHSHRVSVKRDREKQNGGAREGARIAHPNGVQRGVSTAPAAVPAECARRARLTPRDLQRDVRRVIRRCRLDRRLSLCTLYNRCWCWCSECRWKRRWIEGRRRGACQLGRHWLHWCALCFELPTLWAAGGTRERKRAGGLLSSGRTGESISTTTDSSRNSTAARVCHWRW